MWLAALAFALNALWPLVANLAPVGSSFAAQVCSVSAIGSRTGDSDRTPGDTSTLVPHCPFCPLGADPVGAPPSHYPEPIRESEPRRVVPAFGEAPRKAFAVVTSRRPRAPPANA